jgi:hypothetical protein
MICGAPSRSREEIPDICRYLPAMRTLRKGPVEFPDIPQIRGRLGITN